MPLWSLDRSVPVIKTPVEGKNCPKCDRLLTYKVEGNDTVYSHATSVEIRGVYDGGLFYADTQEGGCGGAWHRWEADSNRGKTLHQAAQKYIDQWNERAGL
jgi:hypothetical protein